MQVLRQAWWDETKHLLLQYVELHEALVSCIDVNAAPGHSDGLSVLQHGFSSSRSTPLFRDFLSQFEF